MLTDDSKVTDKMHSGRSSRSQNRLPTVPTYWPGYEAQARQNGRAKASELNKNPQFEYCLPNCIILKYQIK